MRKKGPDVLERLIKLPLIIDLDLEVEVVLLVLLSEGQGVATVARLPTHADGDVHVKVHLPVLLIAIKKLINRKY
jgi:hypothetical protein